MRLAWNKTQLLLTVTREEANEIRKALPIPVSRYRLVSNKAGRVMVVPHGTGNELKEKPKSNGTDEALHQTSADSLDNEGLPRFWQIELPEDCVTMREDGKGLVLDVLKALAANPDAAEKVKPKRLLIAGRGAPKPSLKQVERKTSAKSDYIPTPDWIEARMDETAAAVESLTRIERLQQADIAILEGMTKRLNGIRYANKDSVRFVLTRGGFIKLVLASRVEIDCRPLGARDEDEG